jgi:hypothetical protein
MEICELFGFAPFAERVRTLRELTPWSTLFRFPVPGPSMVGGSTASAPGRGRFSVDLDGGNGLSGGL